MTTLNTRQSWTGKQANTGMKRKPKIDTTEFMILYRKLKAEKEADKKPNSPAEFSTERNSPSDVTGHMDYPLPDGPDALGKIVVNSRGNKQVPGNQSRPHAP